MADTEWCGIIITAPPAPRALRSSAVWREAGAGAEALVALACDEPRVTCCFFAFFLAADEDASAGAVLDEEDFLELPPFFVAAGGACRDTHGRQRGECVSVGRAWEEVEALDPGTHLDHGRAELALLVATLAVHEQDTVGQRAALPLGGCGELLKVLLRVGPDLHEGAALDHFADLLPLLAMLV